MSRMPLRSDDTRHPYLEHFAEAAVIRRKYPLGEYGRIPAGAIGNEQPIRVVSEQWWSPDLNLIVLTKFSDPRSGETTFRLTNVSRAEPDRGLFIVPPDYTVKESKIQRESR